MPRKTRLPARLRSGRTLRFNEAAARCRGKPPSAMTRPAPGGCFNEAAARCRGKLVRLRAALVERDYASMRPRPDAAENTRLGRNGPL